MSNPTERSTESELFDCWLRKILTDGHRGINFEINLLPKPEQHPAKLTAIQPIARLKPLIDKGHIHGLFAKAIALNQLESELSIQRLLEGVRSRQEIDAPENFQVTVPANYGIWSLTTLESEEPQLAALSELIAGEHIPSNFLNFFKTSIGDSARVTSATFFGFAKALCRCIQLIHNHGVIHSAIIPRNLLYPGSVAPEEIDKKRISLVGFGYAASSDTAIRQKNQNISDLTAYDQMFRAPECRSPETHSAYWLPSDIFSIGAILYWLLVHTNENVKPEDHHHWKNLLISPPKDVNILKERIAAHLRYFCGEIYRDNENITKILDTCLRYNPESRFTCIEELQESLETAHNATGSLRPELSGQPPSGVNLQDAPDPVDELLSDSDDESPTTGLDRGSQFLERLKTRLTRRATSYFSEHVNAEIERVYHLATKCSQQKFSHFEVYGSRDNIVNSLCRMLASSFKEHTYLTVTLPNYWSDSNLGSNGRFLTMNKHMARNGLRIQRLFLVARSFHELSSTEQQILEWQFRAQQELRKEKRPDTPVFEVRVLEVEEEDISAFEALGSTVAYLGPLSLSDLESLAPEGFTKDKRREVRATVCLNFYSTASVKWCYNKAVLDRRITKLRYWRPIRDLNRFREGIQRLSGQWNDAITLRRYILGKDPSIFADLEDTSLDIVRAPLGDKIDQILSYLRKHP